MKTTKFYKMKGPGKGKTNNPAGRPPGTPNKVTGELREMINDFLNDNIDKVKTDFLKLQPRDRVKLFIDLLQYSIPKFQSIHANIETPDDNTIKFVNVSKQFTDEQMEDLLKRKFTEGGGA